MLLYRSILNQVLADVLAAWVGAHPSFLYWPETHPLASHLRGATELLGLIHDGFLNVIPFVLTIHMRTSQRPLDKDLCHYIQCHSSRKYQNIIVTCLMMPPLSLSLLHNIVMRTMARLCNQSIWPFSSWETLGGCQLRWQMNLKKAHLSLWRVLLRLGCALC